MMQEGSDGNTLCIQAIWTYKSRKLKPQKIYKFRHNHDFDPLFLGLRIHLIFIFVLFFFRKNEIMHLLCLFLLISASPGAFGFAINEDEPFEKLFGTKPNQPFVENAIDDHLDIGPNCWSLVTSDDDGWNRIIQFDEKNSSIGLFVNRIRPEVRRCFQGMLCTYIHAFQSFF